MRGVVSKVKCPDVESTQPEVSQVCGGCRVRRKGMCQVWGERKRMDTCRVKGSVHCRIAEGVGKHLLKGPDSKYLRLEF